MDKYNWIVIFQDLINNNSNFINLSSKLTNITCENEDILQLFDRSIGDFSLFHLKTNYFECDIIILSISISNWININEEIKNKLKNVDLVISLLQCSSNWNIHKDILNNFIDNTISNNTDSENEESDDNEDYNDMNNDNTILFLSSEHNDNILPNTSIEWLINKQIEIIHVDNNKSLNWDKKHGGLLDESEGWDRFIEILQTIPWSQMNKNTINKEIKEKEDNYLNPIINNTLENNDEFHPANIDLHDNFDNAIELIRSMKEKGKDMSDNDRREMASSLILQLAESLGFDSDSESE